MSVFVVLIPLNGRGDSLRGAKLRNKDDINAKNQKKLCLPTPNYNEPLVVSYKKGRKNLDNSIFSLNFAIVIET
jgi:hypothetical protein